MVLISFQVGTKLSFRCDHTTFCGSRLHKSTRAESHGWVLAYLFKPVLETHWTYFLTDTTDSGFIRSLSSLSDNVHRTDPCMQAEADHCGLGSFKSYWWRKWVVKLTNDPEAHIETSVIHYLAKILCEQYKALMTVVGVLITLHGTDILFPWNLLDWEFHCFKCLQEVVSSTVSAC